VAGAAAGAAAWATGTGSRSRALQSRDGVGKHRPVRSGALAFGLLLGCAARRPEPTLAVPAPEPGRGRAVAVAGAPIGRGAASVLPVDQTLATGLSASGYVYYPVGDYSTLELLLRDPQGGVEPVVVPIERAR